MDDGLQNMDDVFFWKTLVDDGLVDDGSEKLSITLISFWVVPQALRSVLVYFKMFLHFFLILNILKRKSGFYF